MIKDTGFNFDICNWASDGILNEFKCIYNNVVKLLNETKAIDKLRSPLIYTESLNKTKEQVDQLVEKFKLLMTKEKENICCLRIEVKEKFYELTGQVYAMYASNTNHLEYEEQALNYYKKYQLILQRYKINEVLKDLDEIVVYSFRKYSVYTLEDLINETITVVRPSKMNDPFDSIANLWRKTKNLKDLTGGVGHEELLNKSMDYFRIRSFQADRETYSPNDNILQSVKMWSQYADNHKGFCIKYRLKKKFFKEINTNDSFMLRIAPVDYEEQYSLDRNKKTLNTFEAYFIKSKEWESEGEVRLLSYNPHTEEDHYAVPMGDDAIIEEISFGVLCNDDCKRTICNLLKHRNVRFYKMKATPSQDIYRLEKEEYFSQT